MQFPEKITVIDVSARDGLQSFKRWVSTEDKVKMIDILTETGFPVIEVAGFAHPRVIPNLRDAEEVCERIKRKPGTVYRGLAPNARGATRAVAAGVNEVVGLAIASDTYLKKNQNMSAEQANDQAIEAFRIAETAGCSYVIAIGMSFWCPYEGLIAKQRVIDMVKKFRNAGIQKMYLAGSVGMEDPRHVNALFSMLRDQFPDIEFGFHIHNLSGMATANILAALDGGATFLEGAICGIGGGIAMPESLGSVGNYPAEDLVRMLELLHIKTGLNVERVTQASKEIATLLDISPRSHSALDCTREAVMQWGKDHPREHPA